MDRLENMKRNASQSVVSSTNRCALCGDYFYLLRNMPSQCNICKRILCAKCCIDTQFTVDNSQNGSIISSRRNSLTGQQNGMNGNNNENRCLVYLCRLCSEQREFLKKSGVWFQKRLPSYSETDRDFSNNSKNSTSTGSNSIGNNSKFSGSTSNISHFEKSPTQSKAFTFSTPSFLRRNLSSSSTPNSSSTFRFWKSSMLLNFFF